MAGSLNSARTGITFRWDFTDLGTPRVISQDSLGNYIAWANTAGVNGVLKMIAQTYSIAGGATKSLNVTTELDPSANVASIIKIKAIYIGLNTKTPSTQVTFGPGATHPCSTPFGGATNKINIFNNGAILLINPTAAGWAAVAGASDQFDIINIDGVNAATVDVGVLGE